MAVLTTATKVPDGKHVKWGEDCVQACKELYEHITNRPLEYWSPHEILTEETCLIALTDGSDDAVANSIFVVKIPDAREVTINHLKDPKTSTLIAMSSKMLDNGQRKWGTYEVELLGMCRTVTKHGQYITTATARFTTEGQNFKAKIGFVSDSTTVSYWALEITDPAYRSGRLLISQSSTILFLGRRRGRHQILAGLNSTHEW